MLNDRKISSPTSTKEKEDVDDSVQETADPSLLVDYEEEEEEDVEDVI